jgi:predicted phosphodiesterase
VNVGNHDIQYDSLDQTMNVKNVFGYNRFSFSYAGVKFIGIHSSPIKRRDDAYILDEHLNYLEKEVSNMNNETDAILITHYPILEKEMYQTDEIITLMKNLGIDIVLSGHYHMNGFLDYKGVYGVLNGTLLKRKGQNCYNIYMIDDFGLHVKEKNINGEEKNWLWLPLNSFYKEAI